MSLNGFRLFSWHISPPLEASYIRYKFLFFSKAKISEIAGPNDLYILEKLQKYLGVVLDY